ncbi:MAG TPA: uracil-DNA glycosylase [Gemmatimonadaceae bacterium]|nr:uracil-DNA glycosylase [Gemmatimonadaceae bacterium]
MRGEAERLLRQYLEQRRELGERDLVLDDMPVDEVLRLVGARESAASPPQRSPAPSADASLRQDAARTPDAAPASLPPAPAQRTAPPPDSAPLADAPLSGSVVVPQTERELFGDAISAADSIARIADLVRECRRCPLYATATNAVPGEGNPDADLMCVGEAPGANEDATGHPFVGQAGQLLTKILAAINLTRDEVFIANVLKHRPPGNRNPRPDEVEACHPYLVRQIELIRPRVIIAFGTFAAQTLLRSKLSIGKLRGAVHRAYGASVIVTYHPAALLRNPAWKRPTWEDVQAARRLLDATPQ